ncbi:MAG: peptidoglycan DD-metalloendopeptidase family protein [Oscillospiraceae bacterium]|jgi:murein DD-endopeptidase MepM/ murein hydrolase activator NlpD|nr:peptidoglycan DD-metalloendopeptidase family protein [Oscillospiraceae bacterium]
MPPKGTEGAGYPSRQQKNPQSPRDFDDTSGLHLDSLYGLDVDEGDFWASPADPIPLKAAKDKKQDARYTEQETQPQANNTPQDGAPFTVLALALVVFAYLADFGDTISGSLKVAFRRLLFIPRLFGAVFSWAFRGLRAFAGKTAVERKNRADAERGIFRRELKGIRPYLKKAEGDPANWFRRLGVVTRKLLENHRTSLGRILNITLPAAAAVLLFVVINHWSNQTFALQVDYRGQAVGYIRSEAVFAEAEKLAEQRIVRTDGSSEALELPMYYLASVSVNSLSDSLTLSDRLVEDSGENLTNAVGIFINKKFLCSVKNRSDAESVFDKILAPYRTNEAGSFVDFVEDISYEEGYYPDDGKTMWDASKLAAKLAEEKTAERTYTVVDGDTMWNIAIANGLTYEELLGLNPRFKKDTMYAGDKLIISGKVNYVQVKLMKTETRSVEIPYETIYTSDPSLLKGQTRPISAGAVGKEKVTEMVTYLDGQRVGVKEISRERLSEPVTARVKKGTKSLTVQGSNVTVSVGASGFVWPSPSSRLIGDRFGYRMNGRSYHQGIDITGGGGNLVVAALDGTVEFAGLSGSYGNRVVINHGGGLKTTYSHMMSGSVSVRVGQRVTAGQPLGRVGSTGWSSGNHLHFEVQINGVYRDPLPYLR